MVAKYTALSSEKSLMGSQLNSISNGNYSKTTSVSDITLSNDEIGERYIFGDFVFKLASQSGNRGNDSIVTLFLVPLYSSGGQVINPVEGMTSLTNNYYAGHAEFDSSSSSRTVIIRGIRLPPSDFFPVINNRTGQSFGTSGNSLSVFAYGYEDVT